jgi:hypothetical protein
MLRTFETDSGHPSLAYRVADDAEEFLEDRTDPVEGARAFVEPERLEGVAHVVVYGLGMGFRAARLRALGIEPIVFEPCPEVLGLAAATDGAPGVPEGTPVFTALQPLHDHLFARTKAGERTLLLTPPPYARAFPAPLEELEETLSELQGLAMLQRNSLKDRSAGLTENAVRNLDRTLRYPCFTELDKPLADTAAFIVSAGPSLDGNRELLAEAHRKGAVFVVNTAAPAVAQVDTPIDVLVAIEGLDVSEPLTAAARQAHALALDLTGNPRNFDVPIDRKLWFLPDATQYWALARALGATPLSFGGSVATAAFALAYRLGANPIVLVGQDLAYTDGRGYAKGTPYEGTRVYRDGDLLYIDRVKKWEEIVKGGGLRVPSKLRPRVGVEAWGGGEVDSTHELTLFRRWFEMAAREIGDTVRVINATEGGARIAGFEELTLRAVLDQLPPRRDAFFDEWDAAGSTDLRAVRTLVDGLTADCASVVRAVEGCTDARRRGDAAALNKAERRLRRAAKGQTLVEAHAAPALMEVMDDDGLADDERARRTYGAIRDTAKTLSKLATEVRGELAGSSQRRRPRRARRRKARAR